MPKQWLLTEGELEISTPLTRVLISAEIFSKYHILGYLVEIYTTNGGQEEEN